MTYSLLGRSDKGTESRRRYDLVYRSGRLQRPMRLRKISVTDDPESQTRKKAARSRDRLHLNYIRAITCISKNCFYCGRDPLFDNGSSSFFISTYARILMKIFTIVSVQTLWFPVAGFSFSLKSDVYRSAVFTYNTCDNHEYFSKYSIE